MTLRSPGLVEDMPNDEYHADTDWLSSTGLKRHMPERYKTGGSQEALDFGTLFHTVVLEPDNLSAYTVLDAAKIGVKSDGTPAQNPTMTAAWKKAVAEAEQDGKVVVAQDDWDRAHAMRDAVAKHETAADLMFNRPGRVELSAFAEVDGVRCKARFDRLINGVAIDLKSTSTKPGKDSIARAVIDYGYDLSAAHYLAVADALGLEVNAFAFVFVSKAEPNFVTVCDLDDMFLERGRALRDIAIRRALNPADDAYEGASGFLTLPCPRWAELQEISA